MFTNCSHFECEQSVNKMYIFAGYNFNALIKPDLHKENSFGCAQIKKNCHSRQFNFVAALTRKRNFLKFDHFILLFTLALFKLLKSVNKSLNKKC